MQGLKRTHRYLMAYDQVEYDEGWYRILKGLKMMRIIGDSKILIDDANKREGWLGKGAHELGE